MEASETKTPAPPYVPFRTLQNAIEKMEKEGDVPAQIDKSYLTNVPWGTQNELMQALRSLGLIDSNDKPTDKLKQLVHEPDRRKENFAAILQERYGKQLALSKNATQQQLVDSFEVSGSTLTKAVRFFLHAAKYAEIEVSPHFNTPKAESAPRKPRKTASKKVGPKPDPPVDPGVGQAPLLIQGLLKQLPPEGAAWDRGKAENWLGIARMTFEMVYDFGGDPPTGPPSPNPEGGVSD